MGVAIGVDSHKSSLAVATVNELGRPIGVQEFSNTEQGHEALVSWIQRQGEDRKIRAPVRGRTSTQRST